MGFMSAAIAAVRDSLSCGHCGTTFKGTDSQGRKVFYEGQRVFCSTLCRHAHLRNMYSTPVPNRGPCANCGTPFFSRRESKFCGMKCYTGSTQFSDMLADARAKSRSPAARAKTAAALQKGHTVPCLECGSDVYTKPSNPRKFCGRPCYRAYMAKRFDRYIANPESLALPQGYDAFLDREELPCLVEGCDWVGRHLSLHVNQAHGIQASELKRAAGFNLKTGLVCKGTAELLSARDLEGVAALAALRERVKPERQERSAYCSLEGREHSHKSRALLLETPGPVRCCRGCGANFTQTTPFGRALYCSTECRDETYASIKRTKTGPRIRNANGTFAPKPKEQP